jgi:hypothetical protein
MPEPEVTSHKDGGPHRGTSMAEPEVTSHGLHRVEAGSGCVRGRRASDSERAAARVFTSRPLLASGLGALRRARPVASRPAGLYCVVIYWPTGATGK